MIGLVNLPLMSDWKKTYPRIKNWSDFTMTILNKIQTKWGTAKLKGGYYTIVSSKEGYNNRLLHQLIWEEHYGLKTPKDYVIHHLNFDKRDNRIQNLQCVELSKHISFHNKGKKFSQEHKLNLSISQNTSGFFRVSKHKTTKVKQGFQWQYSYYENGKQKKISRIDLQKLEKEVKSKGLEWVKL